MVKLKKMDENKFFINLFEWRKFFCETMEKENNFSKVLYGERLKEKEKTKFL